MTSISATDNPELAARVIQTALDEAMSADLPEEDSDNDIELPLDTKFQLPGGYVSVSGERALDCEVRELNGRDEEAIARTKNPADMTEEILKRGVVAIGDLGNSPEILRNLLAGDREYILLRVAAVTFGSTVTTTRPCRSCGETVDFKVDVLSDIPVTRLDSPDDRYFTVQCSAGTAEVVLPTGVTQGLIQSAENKNLAELSTILLANTVTSVGGKEILSAADVQMLSIRDRRALAEAIAEKTPGPKLTDCTSVCPSCESTVEVPLSMAALFQF